MSAALVAAFGAAAGAAPSNAPSSSVAAKGDAPAPVDCTVSGQSGSVLITGSIAGHIA
jgi:hypothetical protein